MEAITLDKNPAPNKVCHQKDSIISHNLCVVHYSVRCFIRHFTDPTLAK